MHSYTVIGPIKGIYHVGFYWAGGKFFSVHEFTNEGLAHVTAQRMNQNLAFGMKHGE
jgi:hypothetical protein